MLNAALYGLHQDKRFLDDVLGSLGVKGLKLEIRRQQVSSLAAWKFDVSCEEKGPQQRHLPDIQEIIGKAGISSSVKEAASKVFERLAEAEAKVHGTTKEQIHFHEVGAWDSIADIICACASLEKIAPERVVASPFLLESGGHVKTMHGMLACPVPAVLELLKGFPFEIASGIRTEITTPTGAALLTTLADSFGELPSPSKLLEISYGAGTKVLSFPNVLRVMMLEEAEKKDEESVLVVETNIDDMSPQLLPGVIEGLLSNGCLDAYWTNVQMKKGRPGFQLTALLPPDELQTVSDYLMRHTTTIGLRYHITKRVCLERNIRRKESSLGEFSYKETVLRDGSRKRQVEFEDVRRIAIKRGISEREVLKRLENELEGGA
jgi:uncharacterized protein (TIGR00299 family) protein